MNFNIRYLLVRTIDLLEISFIINTLSYLILLFSFFKISQIMTIINYSSIINTIYTIDLTTLILILALISFVFSCLIVWIYDKIRKPEKMEHWPTFKSLFIQQPCRHLKQGDLTTEFSNPWSSTLCSFYYRISKWVLW